MIRSKYLLLVLLVLVSNNIQAEDKYLAVDYMFLDMQFTSNNTALDASPSALEVRVGSLLQDYLAVEAAMAFGVDDDSLAANNKAKLKTLFAINVLGRYPMGDNAELYGRGGFAKLDVDLSNSGPHDDTGIVFGIGMAIKFSRYSAMSLEYMSLPDVDVTGGGKVETTSINIGYRLQF